MGWEAGGREGEVINLGCVAGLKMWCFFVCLVLVVRIFHIESLIC
jgi:hypothetical protein